MRFVFRYFPLNSIHPHAQQAAETAEAAGAQGRFWEMHDYLFEHPLSLSNGFVLQYATNLGLDVDRFEREIAEHIYAERVRSDLRSGIESGVNGTPTFFINGIRHDGDWNLERLQAAIIAARQS
jgi:protein-disulfide isomerase